VPIIPANQQILDAEIRHAVFLERYKAGEIRRVNDILEVSRQEILEKLNARLFRIKVRGFDTGPDSTQRLRDMLENLDGLLERTHEQIAGSSIDRARTLAVSEGRFQQAIIQRAIPSQLGLDVLMPNANALKAMVNGRMMRGEFIKDVWDTVATRHRANVKQAIMHGITQGETMPQLTARVNATMNVARYNAAAVTRTMVNHVSNQAGEILYEENQDIVKGVQMCATLDTRTTAICRAQDGKVYPVGEGPRPPFHWGCRTKSIPVLKSFRELGLPFKEFAPSTRASMNGQVSDKITYPDWLARQPASIQDEALGKTRGRLYRSGQITGAETDITGTPLTLEQLHEKYGIAI
jgi:SPP1 gp7 family putative phage head morphogenesis protein